jgi:predicted secreted protein
MAVKRLKGQNFRVFTGAAASSTTAVAEATNCQVTISGNMEDATTKDSEGGWVEEQMVSKQWSVSVDDVDASLASLRALITRFNSDDKVYVGFDQTLTTAGTQNRTPADSNLARTGPAILNDLSISASNRQTIQVTCQYQGSGELSS